MAITKNTDYVNEGLARLLEQFKDKPRIAALLTAWLEQVQEAENALWDVYYDRLLQNSNLTTDLLTKYGIIVGQGSEGLTDDVFRLLILGRIRTNRSLGRSEDLLDIALILAPGSTVIVADIYPATAYVQIDTPGVLPIVPPALLSNSFLAHGVAAGVRLVFVYSVEPEASTLKLGSFYGFGAKPQPTEFQSPGSFYSTPIGGGLFASVIQQP